MFDARPICEDCGGRILNPSVHERVCNPEKTFNGECPMCGERYSSYFEHLDDCPAT
jgi:hypothetical protein